MLRRAEARTEAHSHSRLRRLRTGLLRSQGRRGGGQDARPAAPMNINARAARLSRVGLTTHAESTRSSAAACRTTTTRRRWSASFGQWRTSCNGRACRPRPCSECRAPRASSYPRSGYRISQAIYVATRLGIPDLSADGPREIGDLAPATGSHPPSLRRGLTFLGAPSRGDGVSPHRGATRLAIERA